MKANELMLGDWLQHASGKCFQITRLDMWIDGSVHFACGHPHLWEYNNKFTPIPLTAEILERNGFEKCRIEEIEYIGWRLNEDFSLELNDVDTLTWNEDVAIHYVHELQHALRLCKIEKEIEL